MEQLPWYVVQTRSRHEKVASQYLRAQGMDEFLPLYETDRKWSDRTKRVELPLFGGYLFCRLNPDRLSPVLNAPGVVRVVGFGDGPVPVADDEVQAIRRLLDSGLSPVAIPYIQTGTRVRIHTGALAGLVGQVLRTKRQTRFVLAVDLLMRSVAVEVDQETIEAI